MAKRTAKVNWYADEVVLAAIDAVNLPQLAIRVEGYAKRNIVDNDQVDTGFMVNSVYHVSPDDSTYGKASGDAKSKNPAGDMAPEVKVSGPNMAAVAVGAAYAIYQEIKKAFLLPAAQEAGKELGAVVKKL